MIVGSTAIKVWFPDFPREPADLDRWVPYKEDNADVQWHPSFASPYPFWPAVATPEMLLSIKISHAFWDLHGTWDKHMWDILFLKSKGVEPMDDFVDFLYPVWEEIHGKKKAKLNVDAKDFFNNKVVRIYDHDSIHASVAYYDEPLFRLILRDNAEVAVDRRKFEALSLEDKFKLVREEAYATALERQIIPSNYNKHWRGAYNWSIRMLITSFSKGWFPRFIVDHFDELCRPDIQYVERHLKHKDRLILL